jgi:hypothetical protein
MYHYTIRDRVRKILASGALRPAAAGIDVGERPAVWLTTAEVFAPTAHKLIRTPEGLRTATWEEMLKNNPMRIKVAVDVPVLTWNQWLPSSGVKAEAAKRLERIAVELEDDILLWRVTFQPIPISKFAAIEAWNDGRGVWVSDPEFKDWNKPRR